MKIRGVVTYVPDVEDYEEDRDNSIVSGKPIKADIGLLKKGRERGTFFRIVFIDDLAEAVMNQLECGDHIIVEVEDESLRSTWEKDDIGRSPQVIRCNGLGWIPAPLRR